MTRVDKANNNFGHGSRSEIVLEHSILFLLFFYYLCFKSTK